jgi:hypothetical protein
MENFDNLEPQMVTLEVTENSKNYLKTTAAWSKFLAIIYFIGIGFMVLCALMMIPMGAFLNSYTSTPIPFSLMGLFYLAIAVVIFFPALYLFRFSKKTQHAFTTQDTLELEDAFKNMKSYWKFTGIIMIVALALCVIVIPFVAIAAFAAGAAGY